jgi:RNA polymerase sigma-70 factor (ECF subfamily)
MSPASPSDPGPPHGSARSRWQEAAPADSGDELHALSDDQLVERARGRNLDAFEELVGRHEERLYRVAIRLVRNENDAQEVLQDALLSAWQNLDGFAGRAQFSTWIYRVTVNGALMLLRSRRRRPTVSMEELPPRELDEAVDESLTSAGSDWSKRPDEQLQSGELKSHIEAALDGLPEILRLVFLLRDVEGLSTEETAEVLGVTIPTVKTRLHRARLALRHAITEYFEKN